MGTFDVRTASDDRRATSLAVTYLRSALSSDVPNPNVEWSVPGSIGANSKAEAAGPPVGYDWSGSLDDAARLIYQWAAGLHKQAATAEVQLYKRAIIAKAATEKAKDPPEGYTPVEADFAGAADYIQGAFFGSELVDTENTASTSDDYRVPRTLEGWVGSIGSALAAWLAEQGSLTPRGFYQWAIRMRDRTITEESAEEQLYTSGAVAFDAASHATDLDYIQGALYGRKDGSSAMAGNQWVPNTFLDWLYGNWTAGAAWFNQTALDAWRWMWRRFRAGGDADDVIANSAGDAETGDWWDYMWAVFVGHNARPVSTSGTVRRFRGHTLADVYGILSDTALAVSKSLWESGDGRLSTDILLNPANHDNPNNQSTDWKDYVWAYAVGEKLTNNMSPRRYRGKTVSDLIAELFGWWGPFVDAFTDAAKGVVRWLWRQMRQAGDVNDIVLAQGSTTDEGDFGAYVNAMLFGTKPNPTSIVDTEDRTRGLIRRYQFRDIGDVIADLFSWWRSFVSWARNGVRGLVRDLWRSRSYDNSAKNAKVSAGAAFLTDTKSALTAATNITEANTGQYIWAILTGAVDTDQDRTADDDGNLDGDGTGVGAVNVFRTKRFWEWASDSAADILGGIAGLGQAVGVAWRAVVQRGRDAVKFWINQWNEAVTAVDNFLDNALTKTQKDAVTDAQKGLLASPFALGEGLGTAFAEAYNLGKPVVERVGTTVGGVTTYVYNWVTEHPVYKGLEAVFRGEFGALPSAFAEDYYRAVIESAEDEQTAPFIPYVEKTDSTSPSATGGSSGDINLHTWDLADVDRIFFKGTDGWKGSDIRPHLGTLPSQRLPQNDSQKLHRMMMFHVGYRGGFMWGRSAQDDDFRDPDGNHPGNTQPLMQMPRDVLKLKGGIALLGKPDTTNDQRAQGAIYLSDDGDVIVNTGSKTINLSDITSGEVPRAKVYNVPILVPPSGTAVNAVTAAQCDAAFGGETGCMGIVAKGMTNNNLHNSVYLAVRTGTGTASQSRWTFFEAEGRTRTSSQTPVPNDTALVTPNADHVRITYSSGAGDDPTPAELTAIGRVVGRMFLHTETDQPTDGSVGIVTSTSPSTNSFVGLDVMSDDTRNVGAGAASTPSTVEIIDDLPRVTGSSAPSTTALSTALENAGGEAVAGALVFHVATARRRLYMRVTADWWVYFTLFSRDTD